MQRNDGSERRSKTRYPGAHPETGVWPAVHRPCTQPLPRRPVNRVFRAIPGRPASGVVPATPPVWNIACTPRNHSDGAIIQSDHPLSMVLQQQHVILDGVITSVTGDNHAITGTNHALFWSVLGRCCLQPPKQRSKVTSRRRVKSDPKTAKSGSHPGPPWAGRVKTGLKHLVLHV